MYVCIYIYINKYTYTYINKNGFRTGRSPLQRMKG